MTHQQKLQAVTEAIHKACPDLLELKFGCKATYPIVDYVKGSPRHEVQLVRKQEADRWTLEKWQLSDGSWISTHKLEILGQPINLPEILRAIEKRYKGDQFATIASNGWFHFNSQRCFFDLTKTLNQQKKPIISLLYSILCTRI